MFVWNTARCVGKARINDISVPYDMMLRFILAVCPAHELVKWQHICWISSLVGSDDSELDVLNTRLINQLVHSVNKTRSSLYADFFSNDAKRGKTIYMD